MATSGTINGTVTGNSLISSRITWTLNSQSVANNTSSVTVSLAYKRSDSQTTWGDSGYCHWKLTINGTAYTSTAGASISSSWVTVFSKTVTITHDSNGAKTFSMSAAGSYISGSSLEGTNCSGSGTLTTIPRASTLNSVTSSVNLGGTATISITAKASSFYHKATWKCGSASVTKHLGLINKTTAVNYTFTIPTSWANQISTSTSKSASVSVQTYSDSGYKTAVGSAVSKTFTVNVQNSAPYIPSVSLGVALGNATGLGSSKYVKGKTTITLNATSGSAGSGASIASYTFKRKLSSSSTTTTIKTNSTTSATSSASETTSTVGSVVYSVTITDTRGRTASASQTVTVYDYTEPELTVTNCFRSNQNGSRNTTSGKYIHVDATYTYSSAGENTASANVKYKLATASAYGSPTTLPNGGNGTTVGANSVAIDKTYDVLVTVSDTVGTVVTKSFKISTAFVTMDFKAGGAGVAIGKIAEDDGYFDVALKTKLRDKVEILNGSLTVGATDLTSASAHVVNSTKDISLMATQDNQGIWVSTGQDTGYYMICITSDNQTYIGKPFKNISVAGTFSAPKSIAHGSLKITPTAANTPTGSPASWNMASTPNIALTPYTSVPGTGVTGVGYTGKSTTGCTVYLTRTNTAETTIDWIAVCS